MSEYGSLYEGRSFATMTKDALYYEQRQGLLDADQRDATRELAELQARAATIQSTYEASWKEFVERGQEGSQAGQQLYWEWKNAAEAVNQEIALLQERMNVLCGELYDIGQRVTELRYRLGLD